MTGKNLDKLSWSSVMKLSMLLDQPNPAHHSWQMLLTHAQEVANVSYSTTEVAQFGLVANRATGSPTQAVIHDFIVRGLTVDHLFLMLKKMEHVKGMKILKEEVSPSLKIELERDNDSAADTNLSGPADSHSGQSPHDHLPVNHHQFPIHPKHGPMPVNIPVVSQRPVPPPVPNGAGHQAVPYYMPAQASGSDYTDQLGRPISSLYYYPSGGEVPSQPPSSISQYPHQSATTYQSPPPQYSHLVLLPPSLNQSMYPEPPSPSTQYDMSAGNYTDQYRRPDLPPATSTGPMTDQYPSPPAGGYPTQYLPQQMSHPEPLRYTTAASTAPPSSESQTQSGTTDSSSSLDSSSTSNHTPSSADDLLMSMLTFTYTELSLATRNFTEGFVGHGAFGSVFRACVRGNGPYAVKKLHNESEMEGAGFYEPLHQESFMKELQSLSKYKHRNILSLVAVSNDGPKPCLIYEYMENGSLADCLIGRRPVQLIWKQRLEIASQVADALNFLHTVNHPKSLLIHGDVKSSNILLDLYLTPKLSDFGLAKECTPRPGQVTNFSTCSAVVMGTIAYMAPEFLRNHKPSTKTDVYAFGVVLLELYTGQPAADSSLPERTLVLHLQDLLTDSEASKSLIIAQADRRAGWPTDMGVGLFDIGSVCVRRKSNERPQMNQVRDQMTELLRDALHYRFEDMHVTSAGQTNYT